MYSDFLYYKDGLLFWKERDESSFNTKRGHSVHLSKYANKQAGHKSELGYVQVRINKKIHLAHRIVWSLFNGCIPDGMEVDHIDGNPSNNSISNLRIVDSSQNKWNSRKPSTNTSGFKGVSLHKPTGRFAAYIKIHGKKKHLGYFKTPELAHDEYKKAVDSMFGEFGRYE